MFYLITNLPFPANLMIGSQGKHKKYQSHLSFVQNTFFTFFRHFFTVCMTCFIKDTVNDAASLNVSILGKVELYELPKATGIIVVYSLCIPKRFHDGAANRSKTQSNAPDISCSTSSGKTLKCVLPLQNEVSTSILTWINMQIQRKVYEP